MPEKAVYSLTDAGNEEFEKLMLEISCKPINIFLDFNAVIVNLESMEKEQQRECLDNIESNINVLKSYLEENIDLKENAPCHGYGGFTATVFVGAGNRRMDCNAKKGIGII